jgi:GTPase SAR1 family protein
MGSKMMRVITTLIVALTFLLCLVIFLGPDSIKSVQAHALASTPVPTATPPSFGSSGGGFDWTNTAIVAAFIALLGVLLSTGVTVYLARRTRQLEREKIHLEDEVKAARDAKNRELQHQEAEAEATHAAMLRANTLAERVEEYRKAVQVDPRIARLQILDMNRPLAVTDIFIRLRLHQDTKPSYELDPALQAAEHQGDPNVLLRLSQLRLEKRSSTSLAPEEALRTYKHCVVVGDPGVGKTTLLKYLTLQSVGQQLKDLPDLPIHIELNAFASSGHRDLLEFAAAIWEERYGFPKVEALDYMQTQLLEGKALLLLDALDETVAGLTKEQAEESYTQASKAITDAATRYHQAPIVVTARKAGYHQRTRLVDFTELEVLDFRPEDIKQFVMRWFTCHPDPQKRGNAAELTTKLERNPRMHALAANPLLLSLIVIVYEDQLDLPERRAELYKQCVDTLLTKWDASRNIRRLRAFKPEHKRQLLEEVAWHFHLLGQRYFPDHELLNVIATFLPAVGLEVEQNGQVLEEISAENGLLKEQAQGWHGFLHLTLQEYFAAQYAVDHHHLDTLLTQRDNPWWEEVLLLYAGRVPDASLLLQQLLGLTQQDVLQDDLFQTNLILTGRCLAAYPTVRQASLRGEVISRLFQALKTSPYSLTQKQAAETLAEIGSATVNEQLLSLLADEQIATGVRSSIAEALVQLGERSVIPQLVPLLANEQIDLGVRFRIAAALGQLGERSMIPQLVSLLADEQIDSGVRSSIAEALKALINDEETIRTLATFLFTSDIADSIHQTLWTLSRQMGIRIFIINGPDGEQIKIVKRLRT